MGCLSRRQAPELDMDVLVEGYNAQALAETKVYIAHLFLSRIALSLSFLPADWPQPPPATAGAGGSADTSAAGAWLHLPLPLTSCCLQLLLQMLVP